MTLQTEKEGLKMLCAMFRGKSMILLYMRISSLVYFSTIIYKKILGTQWKFKAGIQE